MSDVISTSLPTQSVISGFEMANLQYEELNEYP